MPVIPSVPHEAMTSRGRTLPVGQMTAAEEEANLNLYVKPVNYYSIIQDRATIYPLFLARGLRYKLQEKHKKKVQLSVSITEAIDDQFCSQTIFPLYVLLARQVPTPNGETLRSSSYQFKKAIKLTASDRNQAKFTLRELKKLSAEVKDRSFSILLVSGADHTNLNELNRTKDHMLTQCKIGDCVMGKVLINDFLHLTCETPDLSLGEKLQSRSTVSMQSCCMKAAFPDLITFHYPYNFESVQVQVVVTAEEVGAKDIDNNNIPTNLLTPGLGLKPGAVTFKYRGYNGIVCMTEVMLDYACPFCCMECASYKGLKCHLQASHDLFDYEFQEDEKYKVVNVFYNKTDPFSPQRFGIMDGEEKEFFFRLKASTRKKIEDDQAQVADHLGHATFD